jgi:hypothetical protein
VRLPKEVAFPDSVKDVNVIRDGRQAFHHARECGLGRFLRAMTCFVVASW